MSLCFAKRWELRHAAPGASGYRIGGSSSSSSSNATTTNNTDKRQVVNSDAVGVTADNSTINVTTTDSGSVKAAFDAIKTANAVGAEGFTQVLSLADKLFTGGYKALSASQDNLAAAWQSARETETNKGTVDNKTIVTLALAAAGVAAVAFYGKSK